MKLSELDKGDFSSKSTLYERRQCAMMTLKNRIMTYKTIAKISPGAKTVTFKIQNC